MSGMNPFGLKKDIVAEPITVFRAWRLKPRHGELPDYLYGWGKNYTWERGKNTARCIGGLHQGPSPAMGCLCGFWGFSTEESLATALYNHLTKLPESFTWGQAKIWGRIIEGIPQIGVGYRAEFAQIESLILTKSADYRVREAISEAYGVPVLLGKPPQILKGRKWPNIRSFKS